MSSVNNYLKLSDHRRTALEFVFFDDREPESEIAALDQARRLAAPGGRVAVWRATAQSRRRGVVVVGDTYDPRREQAPEGATGIPS